MKEIFEQYGSHNGHRIIGDYMVKRLSRGNCLDSPFPFNEGGIAYLPPAGQLTPAIPGNSALSVTVDSKVKQYKTLSFPMKSGLTI